MACTKAIAVLAVIALAAVASNAQTTQVINKLVPLTIRISNKAAGVAINTATGAPANVNPELKALFAANAGAKNSLVFIGESLEEPVTELASTNFMFDAVSQAFLKPLTKNGATYTFVSASVLFPQEQTATNAPNSVSSATGFVDPASATVTVNLKTQKPTIFNPQVAIRLDYAQTSGGDAFVSLYYTDKVGTPATGGLAVANLQQTYGIYIAPTLPVGTVYLGQGITPGK
jgi:hypothetical protein